jgi:hypothetical protein
MRSEKAKKFKELKDKRGTHEYESWFLNYRPEKGKTDDFQKEKEKEKEFYRPNKNTTKRKQKNKRKNSFFNIFSMSKKSSRKRKK